MSRTDRVSFCDTAGDAERQGGQRVSRSGAAVIAKRLIHQLVD
jgi:hypothetical protein